jgi:hypothetical protein
LKSPPCGSCLLDDWSFPAIYLFQILSSYKVVTYVFAC